MRRIGGWWDRKGENEIGSLAQLKAKSQAYFEKNGEPKTGWAVRHQGLSLKDM